MLTIRRAGPADADAVVDLMHRAFAQYAADEVPSGALHETVDGVRAALLGGAGAALAEDAGVPVGSVKFGDDRDHPDGLYFGRLAVPPEHRGRGLARLLVEWLVDEARRQGRSALTCRVRAALPENLALYEHLGFTVVGTTQVRSTVGPLVDIAVLRLPV